jgi:two-component sensor histidine kinase
MPEGNQTTAPPPGSSPSASMAGEQASATPRRWTLSQRLALVYGCVSVVILLGAGAFTWWQAAILSDRNQDLAITETGRIADRIGAALGQARQGLAVLASTNPLAHGPEACQSGLNAAHLAMDAVIRHLLIADAEGRIVCSTLGSLIGRQVTAVAVRTTELTGHPVVGALVSSAPDLGDVLCVAYPLRPNGRHEGVLVATVAVETLRETAARSRPDLEGLRAWLQDASGASTSLIGPESPLPDLPAIVHASYMPPLPPDAGTARSKGQFLIEARATDDLSVVVALPERTIRASAPLEVALPPLLLAFVLLAGLGALFWSIQRFLVGPLEAATCRLESADELLPPSEPEGHAPSDVENLIRRLGATRMARDEAVRLRDTLLREAHHRIRNHLALVASFLRLQERQLSDHAALQALRAAQDRLVAIGMTYELLHDGGQYVPLDKMLDRFCRALAARDASAGSAAQVEADLHPLTVPADVAMRIALVVNELATNAMKYAFVGRAPGVVRITLRPNGSQGGFTLCVTDNGAGLPTDHRRGLGMTVVDSLLRGIDATIEHLPGPGTGYVITWLPRLPPPIG